MPVDGGFVIGAVSLIGLAGLYTTCVQLLDHVENARKLGDSAVRLNTRFMVSLSLLKSWGDGVGFNGVTVEEQHHPMLDDQEVRNVVFLILANIEAIMADQRKFTERYGLANQRMDFHPSTTIQEV